MIQKLPNKLADLIDPHYITALVQDTDTITRNFRQIWSLMALYVWLQVHRDVKPPQASMKDLFDAS
jgi:hypothetical protein